jgi:transcriptional regulator with XRE-family HTH domain
MYNTLLIITDLMSENNWSVSDLCRITDVSRPTVYKWIKGESQISVEQYFKLIQNSRGNKKDTDFKLLLENESLQSSRVAEPQTDYFFLHCKDKKCLAEMNKLLSENNQLKDKLIKLQDELLNYKTK